MCQRKLRIDPAIGEGGGAEARRRRSHIVAHERASRYAVHAMSIQLTHVFEFLDVVAERLEVEPLEVPASQTRQIVHHAFGRVHVQIGELGRNATAKMTNIVQATYHQAFAVTVKAMRIGNKLDFIKGIVT